MKRTVNEILDDLFEIDPSLKTHQKELAQLVETMIAAKPDTRFDSAFAARLKAELLTQPSTERFNLFTFMQKYIYGIGGAALAVVLIAVIASTKLSPISPIAGHSSLFQAEIAVVPPQSFGYLTPASTTQTSNGAATDKAAAPMPTSAPLGSPEAISSRPMMGTGSGGSTGGGVAVPATPGMPIPPNIDSKIMMPPQEFTQYQYVYNGDKLTLDQAQGNVYKRLKGNGGVAFLSSLNQLNLGLMDLSGFAGLKLQSFQAAQDTQNGLAVTVDLNEESIQIYQNWTKWNMGQPQEQLTQADLPSDDKLIAVATKFAADHGIDLTSFGQPIVDKQWQRWAVPMMGVDSAPSAMPIYAPQDLTVRFPLLIDSKGVYEQYGDDYGFTMNINAKLMIVTGVFNLTSHRYQQSAYDLETNPDAILKIAQQGGNQYYYPAEGAKVVKVELDTPHQVLMHYWQYDGNQSNELFVPALYFPVKNMPQDANGLADHVIVPLPKDILTQYGQTPQPGPIMYEKSMGAPTSVTAPAPAVPPSQPNR